MQGDKGLEGRGVRCWAVRLTSTSWPYPIDASQAQILDAAAPLAGLDRARERFLAMDIKSQALTAVFLPDSFKVGARLLLACVAA